MFQRFFDEGLAQGSYLIACDRTRDAIVVDPRRDIDAYVAAASELKRVGVDIVNVTDGMNANRALEATS